MKLQEKHQNRIDNSCIPKYEDVQQIKCSNEEVKKSIRSFKAGLAGGHDGLLPQHLKDLTEDSLRAPGV